jgi:hypothetical protein
VVAEANNLQRQNSAKKGGPGNPAKIKPHRWKKGRSGNPNGRPPGESLTTKINRILEEPDQDFGTKGDKLIAVAFRAAEKGDFRFFKELIDRKDGKVPDRLADVNGDALKIVVEYVDQCQKSD